VGKGYQHFVSWKKSD